MKNLSMSLLTENVKTPIITNRCWLYVNCNYKSYNGTEAADDPFYLADNKKHQDKFLIMWFGWVTDMYCSVKHPFWADLISFKGPAGTKWVLETVDFLFISLGLSYLLCKGLCFHRDNFSKSKVELFDMTGWWTSIFSVVVTATQRLTERFQNACFVYLFF